MNIAEYKPLVGVFKKDKKDFFFKTASPETIQTLKSYTGKDDDQLTLSLTTYCESLSFDEETIESIYQKFEDVWFNQETIVFESLIKQKNKDEILLSSIISPLINDDGDIHGIVFSTQDITEQAITRRRLQNVSNNIPGVIYRYYLFNNGDDALNYVSAGSESLWGYTAEQVIADNQLVWDRINKDDLPIVLEKIQRSAETMKSWFSEFRYHHPNGELKWHRGQGKPSKIGNGIMWDSVIFDITELVESNKKNLLQEKKFRRAFDQQFQLTALLDAEGKIIDVNDLAAKVQGVNKKDLFGMLFWEMPAWSQLPEMSKKVQENIYLTLKSKKPLTFRNKFIDYQGEERIVDDRYSPIRDENNEVAYVLVQANDITEEQKALDQLNQQKQELDMIFNETSDLMVLLKPVNSHFIVEKYNHAFKNFIDKTKISTENDEITGKNIGYLLNQLKDINRDEVDLSVDKIKKAFQSKKQLKFTERVPYDGNGKIAHFQTTITPILDEKRKVIYVLSTFKDITDLKLSALQLEEKNKELERLRKLLQEENLYLQEEIKATLNYEDLIYASQEFAKVIDKIETVANTDATVLLLGETGTGKELLARAIHNSSQRSNRPLIKINCSSIPKELVESELFGHVKGSFTGAIKDKKGKFELADKGTLFLDEIGDMPLDTQSKLLRALQEGELEKVGGTEVLKVDVRVIAATNKDLEEEIKKGNFRNDLFFRLNVFPINIPPLRKRLSDIDVLVEHFVSKFSKKYNKDITYIPKHIISQLKLQKWPGNVRELENAVERMVIQTTGNQLQDYQQTEIATPDDYWLNNLTLEQIQKLHIKSVLDECDGKISGKNGAAEQLDIHPNTLRDKIKKLGIEIPK